MLNDQDRKRIEAKVAEIESRTAGEIVVAALRRADAYHLPRALFAGAVALAAVVGAALIAPQLSMPVLAGGQVVVGLLAWFLSALPWLMRLLVPASVRDAAARERAMQIFSELALYETRDRTGVLLLVAGAEHRVVILGDRGIHERVSDPGWQRYCATIVGAIREGRAADGILQVLGELGEVMAGKLPPRPGDTNELPNRVVSD